MSHHRRRDAKSGENLQLPSAVTQLGTSLAQVDVKNLMADMSASSLRLAI